MKSSDACKLLHCTRTALSFYVQQGKIEVIKKDNGRYEYVDESVYALRNKKIYKQSYLYIFSEPRYLDMALQMARNSVATLGGTIDHTLIDTDRYKRENLETLIKDISVGRAGTVYIRNDDLISESSMELFEMLCKAYDIKLMKID